MSGSTFKSTANFSCNEGFILQGSSTRTCLKNGSWSGDDTECSGKPYNFDNDNRFDTVFKQLSQRKRLQSNLLDCVVVVDCKILSIPVDGNVSMTGTIFESTARFSCKKGFILRGSSNRTCLKNGLWSGTKTICRGKV